MYHTLLLETVNIKTDIINVIKKSIIREKKKLFFLSNVDSTLKQEIKNEISTEIKKISKPQELFTTFINKLANIVKRITEKIKQIFYKNKDINDTPTEKKINAYVLLIILVILPNYIISLIPSFFNIKEKGSEYVATADFQKKDIKIAITKLKEHNLMIIIVAFISPLIEEIAKIVAVKLKCLMYFQIIFNVLEFKEYTLKGIDEMENIINMSLNKIEKTNLFHYVNIESKEILKVVGKIMFMRTHVVLMHVLTGLLHKLENVYISILAITIHMLWNVYHYTLKKSSDIYIVKYNYV